MEQFLEGQFGQSITEVQPPFEVAPFGFQAIASMLDQVIEGIRELQLQGTIKPAVIYDLDDSHSLRQPIHIDLQEADERTFASWAELHLFGEGETANDAITELKGEIIALYDDLASTPETALGILPKRWLRTLKAVIQTDA